MYVICVFNMFMLNCQTVYMCEPLTSRAVIYLRVSYMSTNRNEVFQGSRCNVKFTPSTPHAFFFVTRVLSFPDPSLEWT